MSTAKPTSPVSPVPSDIVLLLRADAEQRWLNREVIPVLRQIEAREPPCDQAGAALAYLEGSWNEAMLRARQTDAAHDLSARADRKTRLGEDAERYHTAVRALRGIVADRVGAHVDPAGSPEPACARIA
jgi:hypothetical protein